MRGLSKDEVGVEPTVMKIMAGIILLAVGLGIGVAVYRSAGRGIEEQLSFRVTIDEPSATIDRPSSGTNSVTRQVTIQPILGYNKQVTLSATGVPDGVNVSFLTQTITPGEYSDMTISVDNNADLGTRTITIWGTGEDGIKKSAPFELTIQ